MSELVINAGSFFDEQRVESIPNLSDLSEEVIHERYRAIRDHFERRLPVLEKSADKNATSFYFVNRVLHILGYTHSHNEPLPDGEHRVDYALFRNANDFVVSEPDRGTSSFFTNCVALLNAAGWSERLNALEDEDRPDENHPAYILDGELRQTGVAWGLLTNGSVWRLYHRNTTGLLNTYYEVNLREILLEDSLDAFRYFACVFSQESLAPEDGDGLARSLLS